MERSGDVIAVGWLRPVALYVFTIGCALVLGALMAELFSSQTADNFWYVLLFLFVGAFVGYFVGKMLLQKTIHVFRSGWLGLGICCLALLLAFGAAEFDLFGYSRYLPERGAVQAAGLTHYQSSGLYTTQDDAFVQDVLALHTAAIAEKARRSTADTHISSVPITRSSFISPTVWQTARSPSAITASSTTTPS